MFLDKERVNSLILELGLISQADFDVAKKESSEKGLDINNILIRKGFINEDELKEIQSKVANVEFVDLKNKQIEENILLTIPEPISRKYNIIPFERDEDILKIAVLDLSELDKITFLKKQVALKIIPYLTDQKSINQNLLRYQKLLRDEYGEIIQKEFLSFQTLSRKVLASFSRRELLELIRDKKLNNVFELFLKHALLQKTSNIHIEPQRDKTIIKYRIGGQLYPAMVLPKNASIILNLKIKAMLGLETNNQVDSFEIGFDGRGIIFQVNKIPSLWGDRIVLNILRHGESGFSLEASGFHGKALDVLYSEIDKKDKTILITGKENSGKTTTFYTFLDTINNFDLAIGTIEDSIGFQMSGVNQSVVNNEIGFDISQGIEKSNKQNLDVLGVDKIEVLEDLKILFKASLIDRLNFAVLETQENSGIKIIFKLKKIGLNPITIATNLGVIISQKLISSLEGVQKEKYYLSVDEIKKISRRSDINMEKVMEVLVKEGVLKEKMSWSKVYFYKEKNEKFIESKEKVLVAEVFKINPIIKEMILNNSTEKEIMKQVSKEGMMSINEDILFKAVQGAVSIREILKL